MDFLKKILKKEGMKFLIIKKIHLVLKLIKTKCYNFFLIKKIN
jgi:uncharacterized protein (DUF488 family)